MSRQIIQAEEIRLSKQMSNTLHELPYWTEETKKGGTGKPEENPREPKFYETPQKVIRKMVH